MDFGAAAHDQRGRRPGIVLQNNVGNIHSPNIIALPLTTALKKLNMPTHVLLHATDTGLRYDSVVLAESPKCLPKSDVGAYLATVPAHLMSRIAAAHLIATAAVSFLDIDTLMSVREDALRLNGAVSRAAHQ